jgi:hypothetical protein
MSPPSRGCSPEQVPIFALASYSVPERPGDGVGAGYKSEQRADSCGGVQLQVVGLGTTDTSMGCSFA